jgi:hypothetical protein
MRGFVSDRPLADPDTAARTIVGIANDVETTQNGRIYVERINAPHLVAGVSGKCQDAEHGRGYGD